MRRMLALALAPLFVVGAWAQSFEGCSCGANPPGPPVPRVLAPYAGAPNDLRPFSKFTKPYYEYYTGTIEYNGAGRDIPDPDLKTLQEVRIGFIGPLFNHPDEAFGKRMLHGAQLAIDQANAKGGYCGKPFRLLLHNDSATWGASSNEVVKMAYEEKDWAMFGSISGDTTHIALRVALKAELPLINSAATDPTIPETIIPWYLTDLQDDRVQGYTLARHIYDEVGLKRIAILRVNDRYGRFGVGKLKDASRRLGHPIIIEQKFMPGTTDFRHELRVINDSRVDGVVLWTDQAQTAGILKQMRELGMKQRVFGSHRTIGDDLIKLAGDVAEGYEAVFPYDPTRREASWLQFNADYEREYHEKPDQFASLSYDAMQILLRSICKAGLNRARIRDTFTAMTEYKGVTSDMTFDTNCKNVSPLFLATVHKGQITYRPITMQKAYARVGEDGVQYSGPALPNVAGSQMRIAVFGPKASDLVKSPEATRIVDELKQKGENITLVPVASDLNWGKASTQLVDAIYQQHVLGIIALDRDSSHLAEQLGVKTFHPVIAVSSDRSLTSTNIPWIFRLPEGTQLNQALRVFTDALVRGGPNPEKIRNVLASGSALAGARFDSTGEPK